MEKRIDRLVPAIVIHPGEVLKDELEERGIDQKDFAEQIGVQIDFLDMFIKGNRRVSNYLAEKLERVLGINKTFWLNYQKNYDYEIIKERQENE